MHATASSSEAASPPRARLTALYPNLYVWFIFFASLDIMCTYLVMHPNVFYLEPVQIIDERTNQIDYLIEPRGYEVNQLAAWVIDRYGVPGKVVYKFSLVTLVVLICEYIGRRQFSKGRRLAEWAVALTFIPVAVAIIQMLKDVAR